MELVNNPGGAPVADPELPLQQRRRAELVLNAGLGGLPE
jgi:hypothetical protein